MALNPGTAGVGGLSNEIYDALNSAFGGVDSNVDADRKKFCDVIASTVVAHFIANGLVTVAVASVGGVTVGAGVSGPGTGSGTIS